MSITEKEQTLSEKIFDSEYFPEISKIFVKDIKLHIKNAQKKVQKKFSRPDYYKWKDILEEINKIFLEEFGEKLI